MSESDERYTPPWVRDIVHRFGPIALDVCAPVGANPMEAAVTYTREDDGLSKPWSVTGLNWCNPPYSRGQVIRWAECAVSQYGAESILLTQADVSTAWFGYLWDHCASVCLFGRRIGFVRPDGSAMPGAKFGSAFWYFGTDTYEFESVFGEHGKVVIL